MVKLYVGVTDGDWFEYLRNRPDLSEVNFWQPGGSTSFRALSPGELFLFKLHSPRNVIVGGGVFSHATILPLSLAWEAFLDANGTTSIGEMRERISRYRREEFDAKTDFAIGCRILTQPFFLEEYEWIPVPPSWSRQIVSGKRYSTDDSEGRALWDAIGPRITEPAALPGLSEHQARFGEPTLIRPRLGQGAFRIAVTDAYNRRCAVTHERVLPVLEAGHIRPYSEGGKHEVSNGLLFRSDVHSLFDRGYVTVSPDYRFEVSQSIHDEFDNGQAYYQLHGAVIELPKSEQNQPDRTLLEWHKNERYRG